MTTPARVHGDETPYRGPSYRMCAGLLLAAVLLSLAAYGTSLRGEFVFDDVPLLVNSNCHRGLARIPALFDPRSTDICSLRPVRFASFALDHALWGDQVLGYHLTNVLLHGVVCWLALLVLLRLTRDWALALIAAGAFALHPIATEAVAYISGRRDLLMAMFCLICVYAHLTWCEEGRWWRLPLALLSLLAALLSHETAAVLPGALIVLEACRAFSGRSNSPAGEGTTGGLKRALLSLFERRRLASLAPLLLVAVAFTVWTVASRNHSDRHDLWGPDLGAHIGTVLRMHAHYLGQLAMPTRLIADYSPEAFPSSTSLLNPAALGAAALIVALFGAALYLLSRRPLVSAAVLCYFTLLLPASQIVVHHELMAEHRLYLPALCFCALLGALARELVRRWRIAWLLVGALGLTFLVLTNTRALDWRTPLDLWTATVTQVPRCARARSNLGATLARLGRRRQARVQLEEALRIRPGLCEAQLNLGQLLLDTGQTERGFALMRSAVHCKGAPSYFRQLGHAALGRKRYELALKTFRAGIARYPRDPELLYGLGTALHRTGDLAGALSHYRRALEVRPGWARLLYRTTIVLTGACKTQEATRMLGRFVAAFKPGSREESRLRARIARARSRCGNGGQ